MSIEALRAIRSLLPDAEVVEAGASADESYGGAYNETPCLADAQCVEGSVMRAHRVVGDPEVGFAAFLDGIQRAQMLCHHAGVPVVEGTVAAAIRVRVDRRLTTWGHRSPSVARRLYMPVAYLQGEIPEQLDRFDVVDTSYERGTRRLVSRHPGALRAVAFDHVSMHREEAERTLAELWCVGEAAPLLIDGGISGSEQVASSSCAIGVIKSHQTLYADDDALRVVMSLRRGERTSVFTPGAARRARVISWYLRLRDPRGQDAMFGLVRIEAATGGDVSARANQISRWVLAEGAPLALPDARWDRMSYGIRDCEQFLRSIA